MYHHFDPPQLVTPPAEDLLELEAAKAHLRYLDDDKDDLITALVATATQHLDGADGTLKRALISQTWRLHLPAFPGRSHGRLPFRQSAWSQRISLPLPRLISVVSIKYIDADGVEQTLDASAYVVLDGELAAIEPAWRTVWPICRWQARAVTIDFVAGYGPAAANVPSPIVAAAKLIIGDLFVNTDAMAMADGRVSVIENPTARRLLAPFRRIRT